MSKKKSYMDNKNIIKESFFDTLVRSIIPKSIQDKVDANAKKYYDKKIKKIDKEIADLEKSDKIHDEFMDILKKQYGAKPNAKKGKKANEKTNLRKIIKWLEIM